MTTPLARRVATAGLTAVLLAGCTLGADPPSPPVDDQSLLAALRDVRWQSDALPDGSAPAPGMDVWWEVRGTNLVASTGCAGAAGPISIVAGRMNLGGMAGPAVSCGTVVDRQAEQFQQMLRSRPAVAVDDAAGQRSVVLDNGLNRMTFVPVASDGAPPTR
ncbi:hypothetical protein FDO65_15195 [Nakamurella flava]|uniref:META domain-containing protein n=1 Tax=Nakamurella flava TaxID=2576308 RepID=A0A4V6CVU3_9ACTN|nr:hypothetical protein [Nakamurella flava]TKV58845.1 hypothetical protein FDO65_15195 [Nakamurella flava]